MAISQYQVDNTMKYQNCSAVLALIQQKKSVQDFEKQFWAFWPNCNSLEHISIMKSSLTWYGNFVKHYFWEFVHIYKIIYSRAKYTLYMMVTYCKLSVKYLHVKDMVHLFNLSKKNNFWGPRRPLLLQFKGLFLTIMFSFSWSWNVHYVNVPQ